MTQDSPKTSSLSLAQGVGATAQRLQRNLLKHSHTALGAEARAQIAELRKYSSYSVENSPLALESVLLMMDPPLSEQELGKGDHASPSEQAAFHALTLFAVHMQSAREAMHCPGISFASACGTLYARSSSKSIKPRFDAMQSATDEQARIVHLRSLITLLRGQSLGFDYGRFAQDLRSLQHPQRRSGVLLRWGRDFARGAFRTPSPHDHNESAIG
ncbi:type I-E CRISPR-associated protein Cse2/CasB [Corynebacterium sp. TAE3-ERU2]|uniref:type I-E CRISPR-associated protein Cse2/CasB n=1 Tax=Corynebacterium sp. TAE3-ERU2 TaxID=2849497 RepID=UPI001C483A02|nr:type I-E CRISPR-associated protein Cse2/CasB [Corynebacterium sp. TAE3-ERU2]